MPHSNVHKILSSGHLWQLLRTHVARVVGGRGAAMQEYRARLRLIVEPGRGQLANFCVLKEYLRRPCPACGARAARPRPERTVDDS